MSFKYNANRRYKIKSFKNPKRNWSAYDKALKQRGQLTIWLSEDAIAQWYAAERIYRGEGAPDLYSDMAILTAHEIRQVFKLPLRQCEGFINSLFAILKLDLRCPSFSVLSKRLRRLNLQRPFYRKAHAQSQVVTHLAIDSSGLKCFGHDEWHEEKYGLDKKKSWRKLHITVDNHQIIQSTELTDRITQDVSVVEALTKPIKERIRHISADATYDTNNTYTHLSDQFPSADIIIPPHKDAIYDKANAFYRNRNVLEIQCYGQLGWQKRCGYGKRSQSELAIQRYKRLLGNRLHAREFNRQRQEAIIGCSILNKMTCMTLNLLHKN